MPGTAVRYVVTSVLLSFLCAPLWAANKPVPKYTTIAVKDMHCSTCAKKIAAKLYLVPGVLKVHADVNKNVAFVVPQTKKTPSPRAMWEAIEAAGFKPVKMLGPGGKYFAKPKNAESDKGEKS